MASRLAFVVASSLSACGSPAPSPWLAPDAIDDTTWGNICGPRYHTSSDPEDYAEGRLLARHHHEWRQAESTRGMSVCLLDRSQKDGALLELSARVAWSTTPDATLQDVEPLIARITEAITAELKPGYRPIVAIIANGPHLLSGRVLSPRFTAFGGYNRRWSSWSLRVTVREGDM